MRAVVEYILVAVIGLGITYAVITPIAKAVAGSLQHSADIISHPELAR